MSKKSSKGEDVNDLRPFEAQVSKSGQVGTGSRHASYFIVVNEGAVKDKPFQQYFDELPEYIRTSFNVEFFAWSMERNKAGKLHIHLYLELSDNGVRFKTMQNRFPGAHIELRRGSPQQALLYLQKPEGVLFGGEEKSHTVVIPVQTEGDFAPYALLKWRRRSETEKMKTQEKFEYFLENCTSFQEVKYQDVHFSTMHQKSLESAFSEKQFTDFVNSDAVKTFTNADGNKCYTVNRKVYYLWGASRAGKSHGVERKHGQENVSLVGSLCRGMKFDDYRETPVMILDEFYSQLSLNEVLGILDDKIGYLPCRYSNKRNLTTTIVLTSNDPLREQYTDQPDNRRIPFLKRLTGGVWEMYRAAADAAERKQKPEHYTGIRYIACQIDGSTRAYNEPGFAPCEPPVLVDGETVVQVTYEELLAIKDADKRKKACCSPTDTSCAGHHAPSLPRTATVLNSNIQYIFCSCIKSIDGHLQIQYIINRDLKSHFQKQTVFYTACFFFFQPEKDAFMRLFCLGFAHIVDGNSWQNATLTKEKLRATITTSQCRDNERRF